MTKPRRRPPFSSEQFLLAVVFACTSACYRSHEENQQRSPEASLDAETTRDASDGSRDASFDSRSDALLLADAGAVDAVSIDVGSSDLGSLEGGFDIDASDSQSVDGSVDSSLVDSSLGDVCTDPARCNDDFLILSNEFSAEAYALSDDGRFVTGVQFSIPNGFRYDVNTNEWLLFGNGDEGPDYSVSFVLSNDGKVAGGRSKTIDADLAFGWTPNQGVRAIGDLPGGVNVSGIFAVSRDGLTFAGNGSSENGIEAFTYREGFGFQPMGDLPGGDFFSEIYGTNADASLFVGRCANDLGVVACSFFEGSISSYGDLEGGSYDSIAYDVGANGRVLAGAGNDADGQRGLVWIDRNLFAIERSTGETSSRLFGVSDDGRVSVGVSSRGVLSAILWTPFGGTRLLDDIADELGIDREGFSMRTANGISGDGRYVVGRAFDAEGFGRAYRLDLHRYLQRLPSTIDNDR